MTLRFTGADGVELAAELTGRWDDPLVVLLHGGGQTRSAWGDAATALTTAGYLVLSLDLRGHGDSDWAADGNYSMDAYAEDLRRIVRCLDRPAALVGASLGGLASIVAAGESPAVDCTALVLVDVVPRLDEAGKATIMSFMLADQDGFASVEHAAEAVAGYLPHRPRPASTSGLQKNLRRRDNGRYYWHWDPRMLSEETSPRNISEERLEQAIANVRAPILLLRGDRSEIVHAENVAAFQAVVPTAEYVEVVGAAHMVAGDRNDMFGSALIEFLDRHVR
ncbi:2-(acetamidomethylene)succinate hydrolase [Nocardia cerradoensis]|uniref:2-(Acetamidomethylene)succinate hydrolase n=1 Tax=Nocardia cerradoensis TaxID=85688 RepID=A0A231HDX4_9NOCA|nr:alpha/beta fold hydrolase [Nocardia cerradoensis]OXR46945.1 2-(acetamidomethylene)succinate hydrolase [Nocardia cerradoensis]